MPKLDAITNVLRRSIRLAVENDEASVVATDDYTQLQRLHLEEELLQGRGEIYDNNECCADFFCSFSPFTGISHRSTAPYAAKHALETGSTLCTMHQNACAHDDEMLSQGAIAVWTQELSCSTI